MAVGVFKTDGNRSCGSDYGMGISISKKLKKKVFFSIWKLWVDKVKHVYFKQSFLKLFIEITPMFSQGENTLRLQNLFTHVL